MLNFKIYSFGQFRAVSGAQNLGFVPGISGMPETLPETSLPETLPTLVVILIQLYDIRYTTFSYIVYTTLVYLILKDYNIFSLTYA